MSDSNDYALRRKVSDLREELAGLTSRIAQLDRRVDGNAEMMGVELSRISARLDELSRRTQNSATAQHSEVRMLGLRGEAEDKQAPFQVIRDLAATVLAELRAGGLEAQTLRAVVEQADGE